MAYESRLSLTIDSRTAEQQSDDLKKAMDALTAAGVRASNSTTAAGKSADKAGDEFEQAGTQARKGSSGVDRINKSLHETDSAAANAAATIRRTLIGAFAGISTMQIIDTADQWGQYASRIKNATENVEEYTYVQDRMARSANETYRSINETREAFINLSPVLREMGYTLEQSINAVDTFSGLLVVNGANAERGAAAQQALSKSLQKGKVDADAWISIYSTADTIVNSLTKSTGKSANEIRKLGAEGKLTAQQLAAALVNDYVPVMQQVAEMPTTVRDSLQRLNTAFTEYIGWNNQALGVTAGLASGITSLAKNFDTVAIVAGIAGAAVAAKLTGPLIANGVAFAGSTISAVRYEFALASMTGVSRLAAVGLTSLSVAARGASAAMALLGGPAGVVLLAAGAIYAFSEAAKDAKEAELSTEIDKLVESFKQLNNQGRAITLNKLTEEQMKLQDQIVETTNRIRENQAIANQGGGGMYAPSADKDRAALKELNQALDDVIAKQTALFDSTMPNTWIDSSEKAATVTVEQNKVLDGLLKSLKEQAGITGLNEYETTRYKIAAAGASEAQLKMVDGILKEIQFRDDVTNAVKLHTDSLREQRALQREISLYQSEQSFGISGMGQGERARQLMAEEFAIRQDFAQRRTELEERQRAEGTRLDAAAYQAAVLNLQTAEQQKVAILQQSAMQKSAAEQSWISGSQEALVNYTDTIANSYQTANNAVSGLLSNTTSSFSGALSGLLTRTQSLGDAISSVALSFSTSMLNAITDIAAQWAISNALEIAGVTTKTAASVAGAQASAAAQVAAIGTVTAASTAATAATTTTQVAAATTVTAAWTPAALWASIGSFGQAAVVGVGAVLAAKTLFGFQSGGYTGNGGVSDVAGVVHGKEFVFDAASTSRIGVQNLEAMRKGNMPRASGGSASSSQNVSISIPMTINGNPDDRTVMMMEQAAQRAAVTAYNKITSDLATGRGDVSKGLQSGWNLGRRQK